MYVYVYISIYIYIYIREYCRPLTLHHSEFAFWRSRQHLLPDRSYLGIRAMSVMADRLECMSLSLSFSLSLSLSLSRALSLSLCRT